LGGVRRAAALSVALASACREIWWRYKGDVGEMWGDAREI